MTKYISEVWHITNKAYYASSKSGNYQKLVRHIGILARLTLLRIIIEAPEFILLGLLALSLKLVNLTTTQVEILFGELEYIEPSLKALGI